MSEPVQSEDVSHMEPPPKEAPPEVQPSPVSENPALEPTAGFPKVEGDPNQSPFAKRPSELENSGPEVNREQQLPSPEQQLEAVEQSRPTVVESPDSAVEQIQPQSRLTEPEQPPTGQTAAPFLPSVYEGPDAFGFKLSVLGSELAAIRTALMKRLAGILPSGINFPGKVRSKG